MSASSIDKVVILYNPKSTGDGRKNAQNLADELTRSSRSIDVSLKKTEYARHAEKIAEEYARSKDMVLLISSSGDGGYNELINGVLSSGATNVYTSLLPSGNANDHYGAVGTDSLVEHILSNSHEKIDVIKITSKINGKVWTRYAHSYAGIGLTSVVGKRLTKEKLNFFNEKWLTLKYLFKFRYVRIYVDGRRVKYDSLIFSNIDQMSKVIKLSKDSSIHDGRFELNALRHQSKIYLFMHLFRAATVGLEESTSLSLFEFRTLKKTLIQLDGEDFTLDDDSVVKVESVQDALRVIV